MARARNIKPGFFLNDKLSELNPLSRLLFIGLWCIADREGRLEDRPKRIKAEVLPYDDCNIDELLQELHNSKFILRYEVSNEQYIQIQNFLKHQNPHMKEASSIIPAPNQHHTSIVQEQEKHTTNPADSLIPHPDSLLLIPDSNNACDTPAEKPDEGGAQNNNSGKGNYTEDFEKFWSIYPRKKEKAKAFKAWCSRLKEKVVPEDLIKAATNYAQYCKATVTEERFIKHPSTFLGPDKPYEEYINLEVKSTAPKNNKNTFANYGGQREYSEEQLEELKSNGRVDIEEVLENADEITRQRLLKALGRSG